MARRSRELLCRLIPIVDIGDAEDPRFQRPLGEVRLSMMSGLLRAKVEESKWHSSEVQRGAKLPRGS